MIETREKKLSYFTLLTFAVLSFALPFLLLSPTSSIEPSQRAQYKEGTGKAADFTPIASPDTVGFAEEGGSASFRFREFAALDVSGSSNVDYLINSMDVMISLVDIQAMKRHALEGMNLKEGDTVLEIGCGHGEDAEYLGRLVGETGSVLAVDLSTRMIAEAQSRSEQPNVTYQVVDVIQLPPPDTLFSGCHADRFLVSHVTIEESLKKILSLVKPGGVVSFTEPDALSIIIAPYTPTTQIILDEVMNCFVHPTIGRRLPEIFANQGLQNIEVLAETSMLRSFSTLCDIFPFSILAGDAVKKGTLTRKQVDQWFQDMHTAEENGTFLYRVNFFTLLGRTPE